MVLDGQSAADVPHFHVVRAKIEILEIFVRNCIVIRAGIPAILMLLLAAGAAAQQPNIEAVEQQFRAAYDAKDYKKAIELGKKLVEIAPKQGGLHQYNLACCQALGGQKADALTSLSQAAELGFSDDGLMASDPDFDAIRGEPEFAKLLDKVRAASDKGLEDFKKKIDSAPIEIIVPDGLDATKAAPAIVALHGYSGNAKSFVEVWKGAAKAAGAILIVPQGPNPAQGGYEWGNMRQAELLTMKSIEKASKANKIDEKRIVLTGFSQGGLMAYSIAFKNPKKFCGVIPVAAVYNPSLAPRPGAGKDGMPKFYIMVGDQDEVFDANKRADKDLEAAGVTRQLKEFKGVGHTFPTERDAELAKALKYVLD